MSFSTIHHVVPKEMGDMMMIGMFQPHEYLKCRFSAESPNTQETEARYDKRSVSFTCTIDASH